MSFILDALKRAERERSLGRAPDVQDVARQLPPPIDQPQKWNPLLIGVIVVLAAVVLLLGGLELGRPHTTKPQATTSSAVRPVAPAAQRTVASHLPVGKPAIVDSRNIRSMDDLTGAQPSADGELPASEDPDISGTALPMPLKSIRPHVTVETAPAEDGNLEGNPVTANSFPGASNDTSGLRAPIEANLDRGADHPVAPPAPSETANLQPMPDRYQEGFPQITIQVHVYNAEPARRFVMIDGKTYHQGDTIAAGPHIVEIHNDGIVFDWKGHRTLYPVNN
jgi:hypothetical protein